MKNWFINLTKDTSPKGQALFRIAFSIVVLDLLSIPIYIFGYFQTGELRIVNFTFGLFALAVISAYAAQVARESDHEFATQLLLGSLFILLPFFSTLFEGLGFILGLSLFIVALGIIGQGLEGPSAFTAIGLAFIFSFLVIFIDLFASWDRLAVPALRNYLPLTAFVMIVVLAIVTIRQFRSYSIRTKLITVILGVSFISISLVSFVTNITVTNQLNQSTKNDLIVSAESTAQEVEQLLVENRNLLNILALNKFIQDGVESANLVGTSNQAELLALDNQWQNASNNDPLIRSVLRNELASELVEFQGGYTQIAEIFITDRYGAIITSSNRTSDYFQADETWWQTAWSEGRGGFYISQPSFDESTGVYAIQMAIPIPAHARSDFVGVLRATIRVSEFNSILERNQADLLFADSQIMRFGNLDEITTLSAEDSNSLFSQSINDSLTETTWYGTPSFLYSENITSNEETIKGLNWKVISYKEVDIALIAVTQATRNLFLTATGLLLAAMLVSLYFGNLFIRPIENLTASAKRLAEGDFSTRAEVDAQDEIGTLANSFNTMSSQVNDLISNLEQRVTDRTKALATSTEVSRRLSNILDEKQLISEVVEQVHKAFDYYHVHIYLIDDKREKLVMAGGTGEAGKIMLNRNHFISLGRGLVGRAGETNAPILVSDTVNNPDWLPNPLLPDTRSEIAVPISLSDQMLGVLDVQQNIVDGLKREDVDLLQSIANQTAIALQNARTLVNLQQRATRDELIVSISQKIQNENTVENALQVAVREVGRALGTRAQIKLKNPNSQN
jgi:putative methionine-R-sulfoxide reductase with GAF domain